MQKNNFSTKDKDVKNRNEGDIIDKKNKDVYKSNKDNKKDNIKDKENRNIYRNTDIVEKSHKEAKKINSSKKKKIILFILIMFIGNIIFAYPFFSYTYNEYKFNKSIDNFEKKMNSFKNNRAFDKEAKKYEKQINTNGSSIVDPFDVTDYDSNIMKSVPSGAFGIFIIPKLHVKNNLYLGANPNNLLKGVAQVEGTSLPRGGIGSRCVVAGHRGTYKVSWMFRHIDKLNKGDLIYIYTLKDKLVYKVKNQELILPTENKKLLPVEGKDMLTLLTCHPYPFNYQRLLVNCERIYPENNPMNKSESLKNQINDEMNSVNTDSKVKNRRLFTKIILVFTSINFLLLFYLLFKYIRG